MGLLIYERMVSLEWSGNMESIVLISGKEVNAGTVIRDNGFVDMTPEVSLFTHKRLLKDGKCYRFVGWDHLDKNKNWQNIRMEEISNG